MADRHAPAVGATGTAVPSAHGPGSPLAERILEATLRCVARWGLAKTTLDDVAREAGCSRATIYRVFPGGKASVIAAASERELRLFLDHLVARLDEVDSLEDLLTVALVESVSAIRGHEALTFLLAHEPGPVLALVAFDQLDPLLDLGAEFGAPHLERFLAPVAARSTAELVVRLVIAYGIEREHFDLTDPGDARRLVTTFVLPGLLADRSLRADRPRPT